MVSDDEVREIVGNITYKPGWTILVGNDGNRLFVQAAVGVESDLTMDPTRKSDARTAWKSGKRYLSPFMCRNEIVRSVLHVIEDAEMHEMYEWFRYKRAAIYNPHLDPDVLVSIARKASSFNVRENAMTMTEPTS